MNSYPKHIGDWLKKTVSLSMQEDGAYSRLVDQYYAIEGPLPLEVKEIYRLARCESGAERKSVDVVLAKYFRREADGWHNDRCDEELAAQRQRSIAARNSANVRWIQKRPTRIAGQR